MWSRVQRDLDLRVTALARSSSNYTSKLQTRTLVREAPQKMKTANWSQFPDGGLMPGQTIRLTMGRKIT
jgi:hypothetical protein